MLTPGDAPAGGAGGKWPGRRQRRFQGYRGHSPANVAAVEDVLLRVSRLVEEVPEISELDLNPVFALPPGQGCRIVDARIHVKAVGRT